MKTAAYTVIGAIISGVAVLVLTNLSDYFHDLSDTQSNLVTKTENHEVRIKSNEEQLARREAFIIDHIQLSEKIKGQKEN